MRPAGLAAAGPRAGGVSAAIIAGFMIATALLSMFVSNTATAVMLMPIGTSVIALMVTLTAIVIFAVIWRKMGASFSWYDEIASVMLAWVTYSGAALAALRRGHIGFDGVLLALPLPWRMVAAAVAEIFVIGFFAIMAWTGMQVLRVLEGDTLVSLTWVPVTITQSVIPIGAALFMDSLMDVYNWYLNLLQNWAT